MNILLAVDGSPYTKKMLAYLAAHNEMLGTDHTYTALTVQAQLPPRARVALGKEVVERRRDLCKRHETDAILGRAPIAGREGPEGAAPLRVDREDLCQKVGPSRRRAESSGFAHERAGCRSIEIDGLERRRPARTRILK